MENCIKYSLRASLVIVGMSIEQMGVWEMIGSQVHNCIKNCWPYTSGEVARYLH